MKNEEYRTIIDEIDVPVEKLNIQAVLNKKKKRKGYKIVITSIVMACLILTIIGIKDASNNNVNNNYFFTTIYAEDKSTTLNSDTPIELTVDNDIFNDYARTKINLENQVQVRYPLNIQIKGKNIKQIKYTLNSDNDGLLYLGTSYHLLEDKDNSKLKSSNKNGTEIYGFNKYFDIKKIFELTEEEKESFLEYLNPSEHFELDGVTLQKNFQDFIAKKDTEGIYKFRQDTPWKHFFWIYDQRAKEIMVDYNKQNPLEYKIILEEIINYDAGKNLSGANWEQTISDLKKELTTYKISIAIEYNNGIVKEKQITFKEVETDNIDILTGFKEVTVVMEIK